MATRPTVSSVHNQLHAHEVQCHERWVTNFKHLESLQKEVTFIKNWMIGGLGTISLTMVGYILSQI